MKQIKMALVGAGIIGNVHAVCLHENPVIDFMAVVDTREEAAHALAVKFGIHYYTSIEQCLQSEPDITAYDICVNEEYHVAPAVAAAKAGKHILLEKPIAKTASEALEIVQAAQDNGVRLMIAHLLHFDARYAQLGEAINRGELGEISHVYVRRANTIGTCKRLGGRISFMYYLGVHDIEMMCVYAGGRPIKAYAQCPTKICKAYGDADAMFGIVNFDNGVVGCFEIDWSTPDPNPRPVWSTAIVAGTRGTGEVDGDFHGLRMQLDGTYNECDTMLSPVFNGRMHGDMALQIDHFAKRVLDGDEFAVNLRTPVDAVRIIDASFSSVRTGQPAMIEYDIK